MNWINWDILLNIVLTHLGDGLIILLTVMITTGFNFRHFIKHHLTDFAKIEIANERREKVEWRDKYNLLFHDYEKLRIGNKIAKESL